MTIEASVFGVLDSLVSNRVFPDFAPANTTSPYIVYQQHGGSAANFLEAAVVGKRNARMRISCWATTRVAAANLARQAEDALIVALKCTVPAAMIAVDETDVTPPMYGTHQMFDIWY